MIEDDDDVDDEGCEDGEIEEEVTETACDCRCGECCRRLIIEVDLDDAEREPRIKELGSPTYLPAELTRTGQRELIGYLLNTDKGHACVFLEQQSNLCTIHDTKPLCCRAFDCDGDGRVKLIELGILSWEE